MQVDRLSVTQTDTSVTLHVHGRPIVRYAQENDCTDHSFEQFDMQRDYDFEGYLWASRDFFRKFHEARRSNAISDMRNLAKAFFQDDSDGPRESENKSTKHMCLVQYLRPFGNATEIPTHGHFHTLKEFLVQIAGTSYLRLRKVQVRAGDSIFLRDHRRWITFEDLAEFAEETVIQMRPGMIHAIEPYMFHRVEAGEEGSISVPIKRLIKGVKDHIYVQPADG